MSVTRYFHLAAAAAAASSDDCLKGRVQRADAAVPSSASLCFADQHEHTLLTEAAAAADSEQRAKQSKASSSLVQSEDSCRVVLRGTSA